MRKLIEALQPIGRALMLPIAVLPVAGLLLRLGQPDLLDLPLLAAAGDALFSSLGLLFAIGVATGISRDGNGAAALAGVVCYLVSVHGGRSLLIVPPDVTTHLAEAAAGAVGAAWKAKAFARLDVPIGIAAGLIGGAFYNRYATIKLPDYLSFFGGRRFVPIVAGAAGIGVALVTGLSYDALDAALDSTSAGLAASGAVGLFAYGVLNRLLLVTGLHHILNNVVWFVLGDYHGATGDLRRFFAGDPAAGRYMAGFFPIMMFGLPAACLAMYRAARPDRRAAVGGMLISLAATSFLTGVTEPIEFTFMFVVPLLYAIHAVLTGISMVVMDLLGVKLGFGFSAGLFDYVLNFGRATRPWLLIPVGLATFALYYAMFSATIRIFNLPTPGREAAVDEAPVGGGAGLTDRGAAYQAALGGSANIETIGACTTRLRLTVRDQLLVDDAALKRLGAMGVLRPSARGVQVVVGPVADLIAQEIKAATGEGDTGLAPASKPAQSRTVVPRDDIVAALGGASSITDARLVAGRLRLTLSRAVDPVVLDGLPNIAGSALVSDGTLHILGQDLVALHQS